MGMINALPFYVASVTDITGRTIAIDQFSTQEIKPHLNINLIRQKISAFFHGF